MDRSHTDNASLVFAPPSLSVPKPVAVRSTRAVVDPAYTREQWVEMQDRARDSAAVWIGAKALEVASAYLRHGQPKAARRVMMANFIRQAQLLGVEIDPQIEAEYGW